MPASSLRDLVAAAPPAEAFEAILNAARGARSYAELREAVRLRAKLTASGFVPGGKRTSVRIAIGGSATTTYLTPILSLLLEAFDIAPVMHELPFGSMDAEVLQPDSGLAQFKPQMLVYVQTPLAISDWPADVASPDDSAAYVAARTGHVLGLCRAAHERFGCEVMLDNWHALAARPQGSWARRMPGERNSLVRQMNATLEREAPPFVHLHDVDGISASHGVARWVDLRFWYGAKQPIAFDAVGVYVRSLAATIAAVSRAPAKCIVLDLDNTLWGGVIGDDGLGGIKIGQGDPEGEAFLAFQQHLLRYKQRGLLLAVCSKNEIENARAPFMELSEMPLKLGDFVAFKANWDPKPPNIQAIANELNIGLDSIVFVDDNPVERAYVRAATPAVRVVELPEDPSGYAAALDESGWFEIGRLSAEDLARTEQYRANASRQAFATTIGDYDTYLASLEQHAVVRPFEDAQLDRIAQLINKTNQFNLTTTRVTRSEVEDFASRADMLTTTVRLTDRFGDNGLIAVCYGSIDGTRLSINQWLMSCRVFNRRVEQMLMNVIVDQARSRGVSEIVGEFRPTAKNGLVRDLYRRLGFQEMQRPANAVEGAEFWLLPVAEYRPFDHPITVDTP